MKMNKCTLLFLSLFIGCADGTQQQEAKEEVQVESRILDIKNILGTNEYTHVWYKDSTQSVNRGDSIHFVVKCDEIQFVEHVNHSKSLFVAYTNNDYTKIYDLNGKYLTKYDGRVELIMGLIDGETDEDELNFAFFLVKKHRKKGMYRLETNQKIPIKYDDIVPVIRNGKLIYYDIENDGLKGRMNTNLKFIIPPVYKFFYKLDSDDTAGTGFSGYLVKTKDDKIGIYDESFDAVIREEWGFTDYEFRYDYSDDYGWILLSKNNWNNKVYVASSIIGVQQTQEKKEGYFYRDGKFYYFTHIGADVGYEYTWPLWKREYYCVQNYGRITIYGYGDFIKFLESGSKYKRLGTSDGWDKYEGESYNINGNYTSKTYYFRGRELKSTTLSTFVDFFGGTHPMWQDYQYILTSEIVYEKECYYSWNQDSYVGKEMESQEEELKRLIREDKQRLEEKIVLKQTEIRPSIDNNSDVYMSNYPTQINNSFSTNSNSEFNRRIDEAAKQRNEQMYRNLYHEKEGLVQDIYNSITLHGVKIKDENNLYSGTSGNLYENSSAYIQLKTTFENAKRELRNIRVEAERNGVSIMPSQWENTAIY